MLKPVPENRNWDSEADRGTLGAVHKRCPQSERRKMSGANILRTGGRRIFRYGLRTYWWQKRRNFWSLWCVCTDKGERFEPYEHFSDKAEEEVNFSRFCVDVYYGRPLSIFSSRGKWHLVESWGKWMLEEPQPH